MIKKKSGLTYSILFSSILYLSLPVFSHWQGHLDRRVMIIGETRTTGVKGRGRGLQGENHLQGINQIPDGVETNMKARNDDSINIILCIFCLY